MSVLPVVSPTSRTPAAVRVMMSHYHRQVVDVILRDDYARFDSQRSFGPNARAGG